MAGTVTTYTQDLVAPLPVVLQAKTGSVTTQYLYSIGTRPLGQYTSAWEYLLPDALGSVRQIVDANGNVTLAKSYEPYGTVLTSNGTASSIFGYAGEQLDTTGLIYLRARYLNPRLGIFLARDPWSGNYRQPFTLHGYAYAQANLSISGSSDPAIVGKVIRSMLRRMVARKNDGQFKIDERDQAIATPFSVRAGRSLAR